MGKITIVVDNHATKGLKAAWGLSILFENGNSRVLFDTGPDPYVLNYNLNKIGVEMKFTNVVISHLHWDHIGGIKAVADNTGDICAPEPWIKEARVCKEPAYLNDSIITTGALGGEIKEQGLIIKGKHRTALLVGCSHPGVHRILKKAIDIYGPIEIIIGGFHLLNSSEKTIKDIATTFRKENLEEIYGIHCTGKHAFNYLKKELGNSIKYGYAGLTIYL